MSKDRKTIIAVDFDGTLCENAYPRIGEPKVTMIDFLKRAHRRHGPDACKIILWTCRTGDLLDEAVEWCKTMGLKLDAVNENLPEIIEEFGGDTRKIYADVYIDDRNCNEFLVLKHLAKYGSIFNENGEKEMQWALNSIGWCKQKEGNHTYMDIK